MADPFDTNDMPKLDDLPELAEIPELAAMPELAEIPELEEERERGLLGGLLPRGWGLPLLIIAGSIVASGALIAQRKSPQRITPKVASIPVEVVVVHMQTLPLRLRAVGTVVPRTETTLLTEVAGRVREISPSFVVGGTFEAGEVLVRLDDRDYRAALKQAEAAVAAARSQMALESGQAHAAFQDWQALSGDGRSTQATDLALRKPQLASAEAQMASAEAQLSRAQLNLERTVVRASYRGIIRRALVDVGQYVGPGMSLGASFPVDYAEVRLALPENQLDYLDLPGRDGVMQPVVTLTADIGASEHTWSARITRTEGVLDERSRTLAVVARVDDPYGLKRRAEDPEEVVEPLRIGTFVRAEIQGRELDNLVTLPRHLLRAGNKLWVVDSRLTLQNRSVEVLRTHSEHVYISGGLRAGELVCLTPVGHPLPGTKVQVTERVRSTRWSTAGNTNKGASGGTRSGFLSAGGQ